MTIYGFVHLEFGAQHRARSVDMLGQLCRRLPEAETASLVAVDNASTAPDAPFSADGFGNAVVIAGDNSNREFSGWDVGIAATLARGVRPDVWIFSNDTVARNHGWGERKIAHYAHEQSKLRLHTAPWLFGEINEFPQSLMTPLGAQVEWVSSYLFAMSDALRQGLGTISPGNDLLDSFVQDRFDPALGLFRDNLDPGYATFMTNWLTRRDGEVIGKHTYKWYKSTRLTAETFDELRMKARCCLSENMLTSRARKLGADIRSPYDARNAREHMRKSIQFFSDKIGEKRILRRLRAQGGG
jgi:hypothetical protein